MTSLIFFVTTLIVLNSFLLNLTMAWLLLTSYSVIAINSGQNHFLLACWHCDTQSFCHMYRELHSC